MADPRDAAKSLYGYLGWFVDHPEIGPIILRAAQEGWDQARLQGALSKTTWWRQTSESARQWDALAARDEATAERRIDETALSIALEATRLGVKIDTRRLGQIATSANRFGWNPDEIRLAISAEMRFNPEAAGEGTVGKLIGDVKAVAAEYLIGVDDRQAWTWARRIVSGAADINAVQAQFAELAKARFPYLTDEIDQGISPAMFFSGYRQAIAETLDTSPDAVDLMSQEWAPVLSFRAPKEGGLRPMTIPEAQRYARTRPEWGQTSGAWESLSQTGGAMLELFGVM